MSRLELIRQSDFLRGIPAELEVRLEEIAKSRNYAVGEVLFSEGAAHHHFSVISKGHVRLEMFVPGRGRVAILTAGPGEVLAWSALVGNSVMTATAIPLDAVQTVDFPGQDLQRLCETNHEIGYHIMRQLATSLSRRLLATRLQMLDLFANQTPILDLRSNLGRPGDPEC